MNEDPHELTRKEFLVLLTLAIIVVIEWFVAAKFVTAPVPVPPDHDINTVTNPQEYYEREKLRDNE